ncbi:CoA transferase [Sphingomonas sp. CL5.1]|uniref:CaiB/BaiF CoA transferase family protein n=1 Tax=Sphingomonas sp. CL5.1 TaxID=2653203 RepID=UPI0015825A2F|nr:CoA transferase [Sphingomonas sp. CL5.1]QKR98378.1 CoA transferase [Sphingomonas sp. CL5.1]
MSYDLLSGLLVVEVAQFGPDSLGGYLADLGARVIKVEPPEGGDPLRYSGPLGAGSAEGFSYMHLRWNRGKESVAIDLRDPAGIEDFRRIAARADVVVEGMRAGVLERLGAGYERLRRDNPKLVFCSISGMGRSGPYMKMASHGPSFDAFAGIGAPIGESISKYEGRQPAAIGMHAMGLHGALGVLAAVIRAQRTGEGALIEIAAAESSAHWLPDVLEPLLNRDRTHVRPGYLDALGRMRFWARMENYRARDGKLIYIQSLTDKSWRALLQAIERPDLQAIYDREPRDGMEDAEVARELAAVIATRDRAEWLERFAAVNAAAMPVNELAEVLDDPHFRARGNTYRTVLPDGQELELLSSPIRVEGQAFDSRLAPECGEDNASLAVEFGLETVGGALAT